MYRSIKAFICPGCSQDIQPEIETLHEHLRKCVKRLDSDESNTEDEVLEIHPREEENHLFEENENEQRKEKHKIMRKIIQEITPTNQEQLTQKEMEKLRMVFNTFGEDLKETDEQITPLPTKQNISQIRRDKTIQGRLYKLKYRILSKFHNEASKLITEEFLTQFLNSTTSTEEEAYMNVITTLSAAFSASDRKPVFMSTKHEINYNNPITYQKEIMAKCLENKDLLADEEDLVKWMNTKRNTRQKYMLKRKRKSEEEEDPSQTIKKLKEEIINLQEENEELRRSKRKHEVAITRRSEYLYLAERNEILENRNKTFKKVTRSFVMGLWNEVCHLKMKLNDPEDFVLELPEEEQAKYPENILQEFKNLMEDHPNDEEQDSSSSDDSTNESDCYKD